MGMSKHFNSITKQRYKILAVVTAESYFFVATFCSLADSYRNFTDPAVSIIKCRRINQGRKALRRYPYGFTFKKTIIFSNNTFIYVRRFIYSMKQSPS
jgi:hypothetical protein